MNDIFSYYTIHLAKNKMDRPTLQSVSQKSLRRGSLCMNHRIWRDSMKQLHLLYDNYEIKDYVVKNSYPVSKAN